MSWRSLDKIYKEDVSLYTKKGDSYELLANVDQNYYDDILSRYVKMGTTDSIAGRQEIEGRLDKAGGNINDNLNIFQSFSHSANLEIKEENFKHAQSDFLGLCENSSFFTLEAFVKNSFHNSDVYNKYFSSAWCAVPEAPTHGSPGCGELFLAFLTDGIKPKKGDLSTGGLEVELKGPSGRMFKTAALKTNFEKLQEEGKDANQQLELICEFIAHYCGVPDSKGEIIELAKNNSLYDRLVVERNYFLQKGKLRGKSAKLGVNLLRYIGGVVQLFEYKKAQGFDNFLAFNNIGNDLALQSVNMKNLTNISDFYIQINNLKGVLDFGHRADGGGWDCTLVGSR